MNVLLLKQLLKDNFVTTIVKTIYGNHLIEKKKIKVYLNVLFG